MNKEENKSKKFDEKERIKELLRYLEVNVNFNNENGITQFDWCYEIHCGRKRFDGILSNVIFVKKSSKDLKLQKKIDQLNEIYNKIKNLKDNLEDIIV